MSELKSILEQYGAAFEEYKRTNDARFEELKTTTGKAAELESKLAKIEADLQAKEARISNFETKLNRPGYAGGEAKSDHAKAFKEFLCKGITDNLGDLQFKAVQVGVNADGGYAVPVEMSAEIYKLLTAESPMRQVCNIRTSGTNDVRQIVDVGGIGSGWVAETTARPETNSPQIAQATPFWGELYANPAATQNSIDDLFFDVEKWLTESIAREFALKENAAFTVGDGSSKPKGLLAATVSTDDDDTRAFGTFQYLKTGAAAGFAATAGADVLLDLASSLKSRYYANAHFMFNTSTLAAIRKMKDTQGNYLWQPGLQAGVPNLLLGFPCVYNHDMPGVGANALCVAFGDFREAYTIVDRAAIFVLRDPFTNKPYVNFYATKRVGGMILNSEAVKFVKCEA